MMRFPPRTIYAARTWAYIVSVLLVVMGCTGLLSHFIELFFLRDLVPNLSSIKISAAVCLILSGLCLGLAVDEAASPTRRKLVYLCVITLLIIGTLHLGAYLYDLYPHLDHFLLLRHSSLLAFPTRMAPTSALSFFLLGIGFFLLNRSTHHGLMQLISLSVMSIALLTLAGYFFGITSIREIYPYSPMVPQTAVALMCASLGLLIARPQQGLIRAVSTHEVGAVMARRLLPSVLLIPLFLGWLRLKGQQQGLYGTEFGVALFALSSSLTLGVLVWWTARLLNTSEAKHKQTEAALHESHQRFQRMADTAPAMLWITDATGACIFLNRGWYEYTGQPQGANLGYTWLDTIHPDDRSIVEDTFLKAFAKKDMFEVDYRQRRADGVYRWVIDEGRPHYSQAGEFIGYVGSVIDIHARKENERTLRENESLFRAIFEQAVVGMARVSPQGHWLQTNQRLAEMMGYRPQELLEKTVEELSHPDDFVVDLKYVEKLLSGAIQSYTMQKRYRHKEGHYIYATLTVGLVRDEQGQPDYFIAVVEDITRLKQAEQEVKQSEERYRRVVEDQTEMICRYDANLCLTFVNPAYSEARQSSPTALLGTSLLDPHPPHTQDLIRHHIRSLTPQNPVASLEHRWSMPDGTIHWMQWTDRILLDEQNGIVEYQGVGRDITEQKRIEAELTEREEWVRLSLEASDLGKWQHNILTGVIRFDDRARDHYGFESDTVSIEQVVSRIHSDDRDRLIKAMALALNPNGNPKVSIEYRVIDSDGAVRWLSVLTQVYFQGEGGEQRPILGFGTSQDITHRKQMEQALRESEARYRRVVEDQTELIYRYDPDFNFTFVTRAYSQIYHKSPQELLGTSVLTLISNSKRDGMIRLVQSLNGSRPVSKTEDTLIFSDGSVRWFQWTTRALFDEQGTISEYQSVGHDITERRQAEKELEALYNATFYLFNADGLQSLGRQIVEAVVHEFEHADCGLMLVDKTQNKIVRLARTGDYRIHPNRLLTLEGQGLVPLAIRTEKSIYVPDVSEEPSYLPSAVETRSELVIPLKTSKGVVAVLDLQHAAIDAFSERDQRVLTAYAERAAAALETMQLYEEINQYALELEERVAQRTSQLNDAKDRVEAILNNSPDGIVLTTTDLSIQQTNVGFDQLFRGVSQSVIGQSLYAFIQADDVGLAKQTVAFVMTDHQGQSIDVRAQRPDGTVFYMELSIGSIARTDVRAEGLVCILRDIGPRKLAEAALRESEEKFRLLIEVAPIPVVITDEMGQISLINLQAERLLGYERRELINQPVEILLPEYARENHIRYRTEYTAAPHMRQMGSGLELFARHKDGTLLPVEIQLSYVRTQSGLLIMTFIADMTARKEREQQLLYNASLQENVTDAVIATDLDFRIRSWNPAAERIYGWSTEEVLGKLVDEVLHTQFGSSEDVQHVQKMFLEQGHWTDEVIHQRRDGSEIYILSSVVLFKDNKGQPFGIVAVNHDITERHNAQQLLQQALAKEKELSELKSRLVSMASHEFRTPLATILLLTETIKNYRHKFTENQIEERLVKIQDQVGHLREIVEDVIQLSRIQMGRVEFNPTWLDLDALCRSILDDLEIQPDTSSPVSYYCDEALHHVLLDKKLMRHIISNLISNALKYSRAEERIEVRLIYSAGEVILTVKDRGIGIPEDDLKYLFEPFHRASNVGAISGTGLGLVITKEAVERHGGMITVESEVDLGTTFTLRIPVKTCEDEIEGKSSLSSE